MATNQLPQFPKDQVPRVMSVCVVDCLEMIDVEQEEGKGNPVIVRPSQLRLEPFRELPPGI